VGHDDGAKRLADRAEPFEPGVAGEVVTPGERHRWRRREACTKLHRGAAVESGRRLVEVERHADQRRQFGVCRGEGEAQLAIGDARLDLGHGCGKTGDDWAVDARRGDRRRARPRQPDAERDQRAEPGQRHPAAAGYDQHPGEQRGGGDA